MVKFPLVGRNRTNNWTRNSGASCLVLKIPLIVSRNLRTKTPNNPLVTVPWHQDTAYLKPGAEKTFQPTAWIPLIDANKENGCIQVIKGGHASGKVLDHLCCTGSSWYISIDEKTLFETLGSSEIVTCEVPYGGLLLLNQLIPHKSLENLSNKIR